MIYPVILLVLLTVAASVMFIFLLPQIAELYNSMGIVPNGIAAKAVEIRNVFDKKPIVSLSFLICYIFILPYIIFFKTLKSTFFRLIMRLKIFNQYIEYYIIEIMQLIFQSGANVQNTILNFGREISIPVIKEKILSIYEKLKDGAELSEALESMESISYFSIAFIKIGEETGTLSERLKRLAKEKEKQITDNTAAAGNIIQPLLILIIGSLILGLFMIFLLPVYNGVKL